MNLSLDEYRALVAKAFRGVGYPWGLTEDASWAARRLAEFDATSPEAVLSLLTALDSTAPPAVRPGVRPGTNTVEKPDLVRARMPADDWTCAANILCPICVGATLLDLGGTALTAPLNLGPTLSPELLAPFLAEILGSDPQSMGSDPQSMGSQSMGSDPSDPSMITVSWENGSVVISENRIDLNGSRVTTAQSVGITVIRGSGPTVARGSDPTANGRVILASAQFQQLEGFAHRTYAPATEASRAGAGSDTTDND